MSTQVIGKVVGKPIISDIRSGMRDWELLDKYGLSHDQKRALCAIRRILTGDIVSDIRSGMSHLDLAQKYGVSDRTLWEISMKLAEVGAVSLRQVTERWTACWDKPGGAKIPRFPRHYLPYPVTICVAGAPEQKGLLLDISETGASVAGIEAQVDEIKTLCVMANQISRIPSFVFETKCRWIRTEAEAEHIAGHSIENISDHNSCLLRNFIQALGRIWREPNQEEQGSQEELLVFS